jgi:hypothetical protein
VVKVMRTVNQISALKKPWAKGPYSKYCLAKVNSFLAIVFNFNEFKYHYIR